MMATYFNGVSEIQADNLQTLYLMNPSYTHCSNTQAPPGMLLLNPAAANTESGPPLVGIPLAGPGDDPSHRSFHCNLWGTVPADSSSSGGRQTQIPTAVAVSGGGDLGHPAGFRRPPPPASLLASSSLNSHHPQQGLSLSLNNSSPHKSVAGPAAALSTGDGSLTSASGLTDGGEGGAQSVVLRSKYLKAAKELLDEVVNVGKVMNKLDSWLGGAKETVKAAVVGAGEDSGGGGGRESSGGEREGAAELTTLQKQELQMKKFKLLNMLEEVDQRYRHYQHQTHAVASSFEQAAGAGSARSYTALALQTISGQFRCLKDVIASQIKATAMSLGEDDDGPGGKPGGPWSRLGLVDHQLRQQRTLQQLEMVQHNAWRPQRGLPEKAVSVLRNWLFEHFLHPYPKDSDKHMLAKQTGLTRSQVSNWFINARVRLWKPMVEEMYLEEMKAQDQNNFNDHQTTNNNEYKKDSTASSKSTAINNLHSNHINQPPLAPPPTTTNSTPLSRLGPTLHVFGAPQGFSLTETEPMMNQRSPKRQRSFDMLNSPSSILSMDKEMKPRADPSHGGFGAYPVGEIGSRFDPGLQQLGQQYPHGNAVSLTLGPPENHHQYDVFIPGPAMQLSHSGASGYEGIDIENRKRFAAQLLPDFVV